MDTLNQPNRTTRQQGFTLVELMVAMALGLITTLVIAQVLIASEGNRRTTMEGSDAQVNGSIGLYSVLALSGYFPVEELTTFDAIRSPLRGHPDIPPLPRLRMISNRHRPPPAAESPAVASVRPLVCVYHSWRRSVGAACWRASCG